MLFWYACSAEAATINGRFVITNSNALTTSVLLQINTDSGVDDLGGATIVFSFNTSAISINENPVQDIDYTFHNFSGNNYSSATVTRPMTNTIWVNIDLPFLNSNNGTVISGSPEWTDVVTIHFITVDANASQDLSWLTNSLFWGIYDADNSTLSGTGVFEDFPTSVDPGSDFPSQFILEQNYPNPFNPSTKIRYTVPSNTASGTSQSQLVILKVYDVLGNEIATLVDEEKGPGNYEVEFSSDNLASGIYIYSLHSPGFSENKKMVILR